MERIFQVSFFTGTIFTIVSFALGSFFGSEDADIDFDTDTDLDLDFGTELGLDFETDTDLDLDTDADAEIEVEGGEDGDVGGFVSNRIIALRPSTISAFATVFGGVGMIALGKSPDTSSALTWAVALGVLAMLLLTHLLINPLKRAQNTSAVSQASLIGCTAVVMLGMEANRFGQITYRVSGNIYSAPAKSRTGDLIAGGATVTVRDIVKGVFLVEAIKEDEQCQI